MKFKVSNVALVNRALAQVSTEVRNEVQGELVAIAKPIRNEAQVRALGQGYGAPWSRMRVGQSPRSVYVVPVEKGTKVRAKKRPRFARTMLDSSMQPALASHAPETERRVQRVIARVVDAFNRR